VAEVHHFTYGAFNPVAAFLVAVLGSFLGLIGTGRARQARTTGRRTRWLIISAFSIGGAAIWLMHFTAMLGFDVPSSPVRYDPWLMMVSLGLAVLTVGMGLMAVGFGQAGLPRIMVAGAGTGAGVLSMHYTGMAGLHVKGTIHYDMALVVASALIAVVACTAALWCSVHVKGLLSMLGAACIMGVAVCGMHYTGMVAMTVELNPLASPRVEGLRPLLMVVPIMLISAATILGVALSALQAMTEEEFTAGDIPHRGVHAEPDPGAWSLKRATIPATRRPSPRPSAPRQTPTEETLTSS
jgi:NO-binding membrane sensor protein with MHYT domain